MIIGRFIGFAISVAILGIGYYVYSQHKTPYINPATQLPDSTNTIQKAQDAVQQDTNYSNKVKDTVQNQYGQ